jgi:hypothetical protein
MLETFAAAFFAFFVPRDFRFAPMDFFLVRFGGNA